MDDLFIKQEELTKLVNKIRPAAKKGRMASYIPALKESNPNDFGCVIYNGTEIIEAGDTDVLFTMQSSSKILSLALALMDQGEDTIFSKVGMEPTGNPFNTVQALEEENPSKPLNPMINAGALVVTSLLAGDTGEEKISRLLGFIRELTGNKTIQVCEKTAASEKKNANLNRSLCYFMKSHGILTGDVETILDAYIRQCSILVSCEDLARIGSIIGNNGKNHKNQKSIIPAHITKIITTFMITCGMYNASGSFAMKAGIPTKSGVSGALLSGLKDGTGIGVYSPPLDSKGNSAAGVPFLEKISDDYNLSIFSTYRNS
ncbi:glutaminase A [Salibacterium salarium]|uniref:Glutaminase n=1 Tax=Salibacterium salarium TaxID=284579 RepID=A0A3R9RAP4_9BACI|nr:glutaminase A [Salibacterium salarium]RSL31107.1 glutaminase A [Salibacterium salarium]